MSENEKIPIAERGYNLVSVIALVLSSLFLLALTIALFILCVYSINEGEKGFGFVLLLLGILTLVGLLLCLFLLFVRRKRKGWLNGTNRVLGKFIE